MTAIRVDLVLEEVQCASCGTWFGLDRFVVKRRKEDHATFWCPNGHSNYWPGKSEAEKLQILLDRERAARLAAEDQAQAAERSRAATQGQLTKIKNRIANGVCPECHRQFQNVARHMNSKHPTLAKPPVPE